MVDDVLDYDAEHRTLGKTAGKDSQQGKPTYVSAMGLPQARQFAEAARARRTGAGGPRRDRPAAGRACRLHRPAEVLDVHHHG